MFVNSQSQFESAVAASAVGLLPSGFLPGTRIETTQGWLCATALRVGQTVFTMDGGARPIAALRETVGPNDAVRVPARALGNDAEIHLCPGQHVLLDTGRAFDWLGTPVALARAEDLIGFRGIARRKAPTHRIITALFAEEEIVFAGTGLRLYAPSTDTVLDPEFFTVLERSEIREILAD